MRRKPGSQNRNKISKLGVAIKNGEKSIEFWDGKLKTRGKTFTLKIRGILGDKTILEAKKYWLHGIHPYPSATTPKEEKSERGNQKMNMEYKKMYDRATKAMCCVHFGHLDFVTFYLRQNVT